MPEPQRTLIDANDRAQDVKDGAGAQLLGEADIKTCRGHSERWAKRFGLARQLQEISPRIGKALKVVGNGEMLDDIALPGADDATIGLDPIGHADILVAAQLLRATTRQGDRRRSAVMTNLL